MYFFVVAFLAITGICWAIWRVTQQRKKQIVEEADPAISQLYQDIEPLQGFNWQTEDQIQNAPFRSTFHLTMALQTCSLSEFIAMDKSYRDKILHRRRLIEEHGKEIIDCAPVSYTAVYELYNWVFGTYLPKRYPSMFTLVSTANEKGPITTTCLNKVFDEHVPLSPKTPTAHDCLRLLASHVDADFNILIPTPNPNPAPGEYTGRATPTPDPPSPYHLHAYAFCFPSGFSMPRKMGLSLANIHTPVPGYASKLQKSMDRFFATLPFGKIVKRANWAVQQDTVWFKQSGNHGYTKSSTATQSTAQNNGRAMEPSTPPTHEPSAAELETWAREAEAVVPEKCMLRSERQTLHRLESTGALVFAFKTYMYTLPEVRDAGLGDEMADAVEGLWKGSVPAMAVYKRGVVWARKVVEYLRVTT